MNFKDYLTDIVQLSEYKAYSIMDLINWDDEGRMMLPVTPKQFEAITDKGITAFHITAPKNVSKLKKLEGKKKTISALTGLKDDYYLYNDEGIYSGRGLVQLKGDAVVKFKDDIFSSVDKQGRRWISVFRDAMTSQESHTFKKLNSLRETILKKYSSKDLTDNKIKNKVAKEYMDGVSTLLKKDMKVGEYLLNYASPYKSVSDYDEILFNNFKIMKYWMIETLPLDGEQRLNKEKIEKMGIDVELLDANDDSNYDMLMRLIRKEGGK